MLSSLDVAGSDQDLRKNSGFVVKDASIQSEQELAEMMSKPTVQNSRAKEHLEGPNKFIHTFLLGHEPEFVRVARFRAKGWQNKEGDEHFERQREKSDSSDAGSEKGHFNMMKKIGDEMQQATEAFTAPAVQDKQIKVLDLCMAPGGYSATALKYNPTAEVYGITLGENKGGHRLVIDTDKLECVKYMDLTMLVTEFSSRPIPKDHPDYSNLICIRPFKRHSFDLVLCDGNVLRTHERAFYRKERENEIIRLNCSQLILTLQRIVQGGTMIMLLHKADYWDSAYLIYLFDHFSKIQLFKPTRCHASKGSFYLIAKDIQPKHPDAENAVKEWKEAWWRATCGTEDGKWTQRPEHNEEFVTKVLEKFGEKLIQLARPIWRIQADALSKTTYAGDGS